MLHYTLYDGVCDGRAVYGGTRIDFAALVDDGSGKFGGIPWEWKVLAALDAPLSFAADTAVLPVSVPLYFYDFRVWEEAGCYRTRPKPNSKRRKTDKRRRR